MTSCGRSDNLENSTARITFCSTLFLATLHDLLHLSFIPLHKLSFHCSGVDYEDINHAHCKEQTCSNYSKIPCSASQDNYRLNCTISQFNHRILLPLLDVIFQKDIDSHPCRSYKQSKDFYQKNSFVLNNNTIDLAISDIAAGRQSSKLKYYRSQTVIIISPYSFHF